MTNKYPVIVPLVFRLVLLFVLYSLVQPNPWFGTILLSIGIYLQLGLWFDRTFKEAYYSQKPKDPERPCLTLDFYDEELLSEELKQGAFIEIVYVDDPSFLPKTHNYLPPLSKN